MGKPNGNAKDEAQSTKERILQQAIKVFSRYGYHGTTTRMIANEAGINISALHYHWGDKRELYEAAVIFVNKAINRAHKELGAIIKDLPPEEKITHSVSFMSQLLFANPEYASLSLLSSIFDTRDDAEHSGDVKNSTKRNYNTIVREFYGEEQVTKQSMLELVAVTQAMQHLILGQTYFTEFLDVNPSEYVDMVNNIMKKLYRITLPVD